MVKRTHQHGRKRSTMPMTVASTFPRRRTRLGSNPRGQSTSHHKTGMEYRTRPTHLDRYDVPPGPRTTPFDSLAVWLACLFPHVHVRLFRFHPKTHRKVHFRHTTRSFDVSHGHQCLQLYRPTHSRTQRRDSHSEARENPLAVTGQTGRTESCSFFFRATESFPRCVTTTKTTTMMFQDVPASAVGTGAGTARPIPTLFQSAIQSISWPLDPDSSPPLYLEPLDSMRNIRSKTLQPSDPLADVLRELPGSIEPLVMCPDGNEDHRNFGLIALALLLLGNGYTDECHSLVTPLSWPDDIHFGYGPSMYGKVSVEAQAYATYVHSLVHRREAFQIGEGGMQGFSNAMYWSNAAGRSRGVDTLPHYELFDSVVQISSDYGPTGVSESESVQAWCTEHGFVPANNHENVFYENRAVHELCANVLRNNKEKDSDVESKRLQAFAESVAEGEVRIVLAHALRRAGFSVGENSCRRI